MPFQSWIVQTKLLISHSLNIPDQFLKVQHLSFFYKQFLLTLHVLALDGSAKYIHFVDSRNSTDKNIIGFSSFKGDFVTISSRKFELDHIHFGGTYTFTDKILHSARDKKEKKILYTHLYTVS